MFECESREFEVKAELEKKREDIKSFDDLISFLQNVKDNYNSCYGEAPRAIAQALLATAWYLASEFGITAFQAGFVMWDFIKDWLFDDNECGMKLIDYDNMLYPQYEYKFEKHLTRSTYEALQKKARENLEKDKIVHPSVREHWQSIADGHVPFGYTVVEK